jgi:3-phosphoshikimate 1-carboxyvinyltransferase
VTADARVVAPLAQPPDETVKVPGSKSITNRALVCAALARRPSTIAGALFADDTDAMIDCLRKLGVLVTVEGSTIHVASRRWHDRANLDARLSGTTSRFLLPMLATGSGTYRLDGAPPLQARPMKPSLDALRSIGAKVIGDSLPVEIHGPVMGGSVAVRGDLSSQFLSGLLLAGAVMPKGLHIDVTTKLVSKPYVDLTIAVMEQFGATPTMEHVPFTGYAGGDYSIEPDASAASYFFAAAAITGGRVTVEGLGTDSLQGDVAFVDLLAQMGASVEKERSSITVRGTGTLHGIDVDLADHSDLSQTLAAVAVFADSPTRMSGIGFIRDKESNRIGDVIRELGRIGIRADEEDDGYVVHPGTPTAGCIETYDDHRMAMGFALIGLKVPGISIADPECVSKTFPGFWDALESLR